ncbi:hypothetical protein ACA910_008431 [Epithemia clementina (nom. ined.)]
MLSALEEIQALNIVGVELMEEGNFAEAASAFSCCISQLSWCILTPTPIQQRQLPSPPPSSFVTQPDEDAGSSSNNVTPTTITRFTNSDTLKAPQQATFATPTAATPSDSWDRCNHNQEEEEEASNNPSSSSRSLIFVYSNQEEVIDRRSEYFYFPFLFEGAATGSSNSSSKARNNRNEHKSPSPGCCSSCQHPPKQLRLAQGQEQLEASDSTAGTRGACSAPKPATAQEIHLPACESTTTSNEEDVTTQQDEDNVGGSSSSSASSFDPALPASIVMTLTSSQHVVLTICCLYNFALCHHLEWDRRQRKCSRLLESALDLYERAFSILRLSSLSNSTTSLFQSHSSAPATSSSTSSESSSQDQITFTGEAPPPQDARALLPWFCSPSDTILKVLMAICTNITHCLGELAHVEAYNKVWLWNQRLHAILQYCHTPGLYYNPHFWEALMQEDDDDDDDDDEELETVTAATITTSPSLGGVTNSSINGNSSDEGEDDDDDEVLEPQQHPISLAASSHVWPSCHQFFTLNAFLNSLPQTVARAA